MKTITPHFIVSPDKPELNLSDDEIHTRRTWFELKLTQQGLSFRKALGRYQGRDEAAYIVLVHDEVEERSLYRLAEAFKQDSVLSVDANGYAALFDADGKYLKNLGPFEEVSEEDAKTIGSYTYAGGKYYAARGA